MMPKKLTDPTEFQIALLESIARLEERAENNGDVVKRIEFDPEFLDKVVRESNELLNEIQKIRFHAIKTCELGDGKKKAQFFRDAVIERSKNDPVYWINHWAWIFNPHLTKYKFPSKLPFVLFPKQVEYINWREERYRLNQSGVVYKCREVGASWLNVASQTWHWLFEDGFQGRFGSRKEGLVDDKNNPDTLFWKIRFIIYNTPHWMRHAELADQNNKHDNRLVIFNPTTKAVIAGEGGDNMGTGGRASMYDIDEWAKVEHDKSVEASVSMNSPCRFYTSTPNGPANDFAQKVNARHQKGATPVFDFVWTDDPRKTQDWYDNFKEAHEYDPSIIAQEVDRRFDAFSQGSAIPIDWVQASVKLYKKIKDGEIDYSSEERKAGFDVAAGGANKSVVMLRNGIVLEEPLEWDIGDDTTLATVTGEAIEGYGADTVGYDVIGVGFGMKAAHERFSFLSVPIDARKLASEVPLDGDTAPARDRCANRRVELVLRVRAKYLRTYEFVEKGIDHDIETLIATPNNGKLTAQLSIPDLKKLGGKFSLESKEAMVKRGIESPDLFDATMYSWNEADEMKAVKTFNPKSEGILEENDYPVNMMLSQGQNYISIYHAENFAVGVVGAVWKGSGLLVYNEHSAQNSSVVQTVMALSRFPKAYEYVGNKEMFSKNKDDLFMQYLEHNIMVSENFLYDDMSSIALLNQMFDRKQIRVMKKCTTLLRQLEGFARKQGVPDKNGMEVAMALCNIVNRLSEYIKIEEPIKPHRGYRVRV